VYWWHAVFEVATSSKLQSKLVKTWSWPTGLRPWSRTGRRVTCLRISGCGPWSGS